MSVQWVVRLRRLLRLLVDVLLWRGRMRDAPPFGCRGGRLSGVSRDLEEVEQQLGVGDAIVGGFYGVMVHTHARVRHVLDIVGPAGDVAGGRAVVVVGVGRRGVVELGAGALCGTGVDERGRGGAAVFVKGRGLNVGRAGALDGRRRRRSGGSSSVGKGLDGGAQGPGRGRQDVGVWLLEVCMSVCVVCVRVVRLLGVLWVWQMLRRQSECGECMDALAGGGVCGDGDGDGDGGLQDGRERLVLRRRRGGSASWAAGQVGLEGRDARHGGRRAAEGEVVWAGAGAGARRRCSGGRLSGALPESAIESGSSDGGGGCAHSWAAARGSRRAARGE
jgi:hypothetical protein